MKHQLTKETKILAWIAQAMRALATFRGRNLYRNKVYRKKWNDESLRKVSLEEKHVRGDQARLERQMRQNF